jgi:hypothetical protein
MKKLSLLITASVIFLSSYSQQNDFLLQRPVVKSVDSIEQANKGEKFEASFKISVAADYFPNADKFNLDNPLIFFRKSGSFTTEMNYYYSVPDSIIRLVSYSWDGNQKSSGELKTLYESNANYFSKYFGKAGVGKDETHSDWSQKSLTWQNDIVYVYQFLVSSRGTNRVRVLISWK